MVEYAPTIPAPAGMEKFIRPEHVQRAAFLSAEKRVQFETGIRALWNRALAAPDQSTERISACQKLAEVTQQLHVQNQRYKQHQAQQQAMQNSNPAGQTQQQAQQQAQAQAQAQQQQQQQQMQQMQQQAQQSAAQAARPPTQDLTGIPGNAGGTAATKRAASLREEMKRLVVNLVAPAAIVGAAQAQDWVDQHKNQAENMCTQSEQTMAAISSVHRQVIEKTKKEPLTDSDKAKVAEKINETYNRLNKLSDAMMRLRQTFVQNQRPQGNTAGQTGSGVQNQSSQQQAQVPVKTEALEHVGGASHGTQVAPSPTTNAPAPGHTPVPINRAAQPQVNPAARPMAQPVQGANAPYALSHKDAVDKARSYQPAQTPTSAAPAHSHPSMPRPDSQPRVPEARGYAAANKTLNVAPLQPVGMNPARPTLTAGPGQPPGVMGQPGLQRHPGYVLEGEGERVLSEKKLEELVREVTGSGGGEGAETLDSEVKETLLDLADEFIENVVMAACKVAKLRNGSTLDIRDIQLILERNYNIRVPGYASDELRTVKKIQPTQEWARKMSAVQAAKVTGGKTDL